MTGSPQTRDPATSSETQSIRGKLCLDKICSAVAASCMWERASICPSCGQGFEVRSENAT